MLPKRQQANIRLFNSLHQHQPRMGVLVEQMLEWDKSQWSVENVFFMTVFLNTCTLLAT